MEDKRFFWIKLKTDFFQEDSPIDFLLSQANGSEYVVLYIKLCLMTANGGGKLQRRIGEMIIPYDVDKITRDMKYFSRDTVIVALELYKKLGLIYQELDGTLVIAHHSALVGSESASREAIKKRNQRQKKKIQNSLPDNGGDNEGDTEGTNCPTEYRDKSIEIRDKSIENRAESTEEESAEEESAEENIEETASVETVCQTQSVRPAIDRIVEEWNTLRSYGIPSVSRITSDSKRYKSLVARLNQFSEPQIFDAIQKIRESEFLQGVNNRGWVITFDWFVLPTNFLKVLDGNYAKHKGRKEDNLSGIKDWYSKHRGLDDDGSSASNNVSTDWFSGNK